MKNEEKYRTPEERARAFERFCDRFDTCKECKARNNVSCILSWLEMEADEEAERIPAIGTDGEAERSPAIGTDGAGKPVETRLESGAFLTPKKVLDELAHGCASTQEKEKREVEAEPEKKRTNLEFCGLKLSRYSCKDGTMYIGTRDFRPSGDKQLWSVDVILDSSGGHIGAVRKNGHLIARVNDTTLSRSLLEHFLIGGLHAVLKRKQYQQKKTKARRKAKKAANRPIGDRPSGRMEV